jgi:hypothetical protein
VVILWPQGGPIGTKGGPNRYEGGPNRYEGGPNRYEGGAQSVRGVFWTTKDTTKDTTNRARNITVPRQGSEGRELIEEEGRGEGANRSGRARGGTAGVGGMSAPNSKIIIKGQGSNARGWMGRVGKAGQQG